MDAGRRRFLATGATGALGLGAFAAPAMQAAPTGGGFATTVAAVNAPQSMKDVADFVCNGSNDQNTINAAINSMVPLGGVVLLSPGNFNCFAPVRTRKRTSLVGSGRATRLVAKSDAMIAVISSRTTAEDKMEVAHLAIIGEGRFTNGISWNITSNVGFDEGSPDASNRISDVYVSNVGRSGISLSGGRNRGPMVQRVRVLNAGQYGFNIQTPDGFFDQCNTGSSGLPGFRITNSNNRFTNCKAWFSDRSGFAILANRNQFTACESQDNERHGFEIQAGQISMTSCHADSNSWNSAANTSSWDGFFIAFNRSWVDLIACQAYDKNESGRGYWQRWGFNLAGANQYCNIIGSARDNVTAKLRNGSSNITTNRIEVLGP